MTILEAITRIDGTKPNSYTQEEKIAWLSTLDGIIKKEIIDTHEGGNSKTFEGYDESTSLEVPLIVPAPYDGIYLRWLEACIDYANGEYGRYNNSTKAYNAALEAYAAHYNKHNMPRRKAKRFIF